MLAPPKPRNLKFGCYFCPVILMFLFEMFYPSTEGKCSLSFKCLLWHNGKKWIWKEAKKRQGKARQGKAKQKNCKANIFNVLILYKENHVCGNYVNNVLNGFWLVVKQAAIWWRSTRMFASPLFSAPSVTASVTPPLFRHTSLAPNIAWSIWSVFNTSHFFEHFSIESLEMRCCLQKYVCGAMLT
jgi:hypothetical protein